MVNASAVAASPPPWQALSAFLVHFPVWGRNAEDGGWWAQRSRDATLKVLITLHEQEPTQTDMLPAFLAASARDRALAEA